MVKNSSQRSDTLQVMGEVTESLPNAMFRVNITEGPEELVGKTVLCTLNGKMRRFRIRVLPGDKVNAELSVYDLNRGRVTRRLREDQQNVLNEEQTEE